MENVPNAVVDDAIVSFDELMDYDPGAPRHTTWDREAEAGVRDVQGRPVLPPEQPEPADRHVHHEEPEENDVGLESLFE